MPMSDKNTNGLLVCGLSILINNKLDTLNNFNLCMYFELAGFEQSKENYRCLRCKKTYCPKRALTLSS